MSLGRLGSMGSTPRGGAVLSGGSREDKVKGLLFRGVLLFSLLIGFVTLIVLLIDVANDGLEQAQLGLHLVVSLLAPVTGGHPVADRRNHLSDAANGSDHGARSGSGRRSTSRSTRTGKRWYNRAIEINIQNLAGVPSIVYGILGLAFLVRGLDLGRVLLAGALTLSLLVLPIVIIASREAIRAVPPSIREGALALGATKWQMIRRQVLPAAIPGIATGSILALSRAIGETAPLILIGAIVFVPFNPRGTRQPVHGAADPDLQLDHEAAGGVPPAGRRSDPRAARAAADHECIRNLAPEQIST